MPIKKTLPIKRNLLILNELKHHGYDIWKKSISIHLILEVLKELINYTKLLKMKENIPFP